MKAWDEIDEELARKDEATYTPPAKPMTEAERRLLGMMNAPRLLEPTD